MTKQQDAMFFVNSSANSEQVWSSEIGAVKVYRCGEMRILKKNPDGSQDIIRYSDQLEKVGLKSDDQLTDLFFGSNPEFEMIHNPWFEVVNTTRPEDEGVVFDDLAAAIAFAVECERG